MFGPRARSAIWEWHHAKGIETTGYLSRDEAEVLAAAGAEYPRATGVAESGGAGRAEESGAYFAADGPKCGELDEVVPKNRAG